MYLHLGQNYVINKNDIIGIFDIDNTTTSKTTREFLAKAEQNGTVYNIVSDIPKSFVVCRIDNKDVVYITQLSSSTLLKRYNNDTFLNE